MPVIYAKRGDTFAIECTRTDRDTGAAIDLTDVSIAAWLKIGSQSVVASVTKTNPTAGRFTCVIDAATMGGVPLEFGEMDIEFSKDGIVASSETVKVGVLKDITNAP